MLWHQQQAL